MEYFTTYFKVLQAANLAEITEHSLRPDLKNLLSAVANTVDSKIKILHEGKREGKFGAPDFKVTRVENIIGYVENKKIDESLDKILKSDQIKKYQQLSDNILITNYLEWVWLNKGNIQRETLCYLSDIENKKAKLDPNKANTVGALIQGFFSFAPEGIGKPKELAEALAIRGKILKEFLADELERQERVETKGKLFGLYETFQKYIFNDLTLHEFADAFSQNLIYGVFLAKLNADTQTVTLSNADEFIPANFELIRELVEFLKVLQRKEYTDIRWVIEEILTILNTMNFRDIKVSLSFTKQFTPEEDPYAIKDPYVYFYEDFLAAYDKKLRKSKGVYYTPPQVVNFIVRSVDTILKNTFNLHEGFADHEKVTVLDFAAGTGTFLLEVIRQIFRKYPNKTEKQLLVHDHILKNLYGFEYLIAPYTIAHLKLSQFLKDNSCELQENERFQIFLTNTLEPTSRQINIPLLPALTEETKQAQEVKEKPILVITGNPPYSLSSQNKNTILGLNLLKDYKEGLNEKKLNLDDDYIKFIRFAHYKIEQEQRGIIAIITNNSYLDGVNHRRMREKILKDFDKIYIVNLHGNSKTERGDQNVFDITVGVSIIFLIKTGRPVTEKQVYYFSTKGHDIISRDDKYTYLKDSGIDDVQFETVTPTSPYFLFISTRLESTQNYQKFFGLTEIFNLSGSAVKTDRDDLCYDFDKDAISERFQKLFSKNFDDEFRKKYKIEDSGSYNLTERIGRFQFDHDAVREVYYRVFDKRFIYYQNGFTSRPNYELNQHLFHPNLALISGRAGNVVRHDMLWSLIFITDKIIDTNLFYRGGGTLFPIYSYLFIKKSHPENSDAVRTENFKSTFRRFVNEQYQKTYSPEDIVGYIYAILHSPSYRIKYSEYLNIDFPRIPFIKDSQGFENLATLGWQLIQSHTMNEIPDYEIGQYNGEGNNEVTKPEYRKTSDYERLYINKTQYFDHVPENAYHFYIGGYQVLDKYLKDRKSRKLTLSEVKTVKNIIKILALTIEQMQKIDEATKDWI